jgi:hypothetical protein
MEILKLVPLLPIGAKVRHHFTHIEGDQSLNVDVELDRPDGWSEKPDNRGKFLAASLQIRLYGPIESTTQAVNNVLEATRASLDGSRIKSGVRDLQGRKVALTALPEDLGGISVSLLSCRECGDAAKYIITELGPEGGPSWGWCGKEHHG